MKNAEVSGGKIIINGVDNGEYKPKFPKPRQKEIKKVEPGENQEKHSVSTPRGISKGSYMSETQVGDLKVEVEEGKEGIMVTREYNRKNKIVS